MMKEEKKAGDVVTDLLFGVISGFGDRHYFFADIDDMKKRELVRRVRRVCIERRGMGHCYIVKSGRGWHVVNFSDELTLEEYLKALKEIGADKHYVFWVKKVGYGVLRISRRSSHWKVPRLDSIVMSPEKKEENEMLKSAYFGLLQLEERINKVLRVKVKRLK